MCFVLFNRGHAIKNTMEKELNLATAEDAVQYQLFLLTDKPEDPQHCQEILQQYIERILAHFAPVLVSYIWQNQTFNLKYKPAKGKYPCFPFVLIPLNLENGPLIVQKPAECVHSATS